MPQWPLPPSMSHLSIMWPNYEPSNGFIHWLGWRSSSWSVNLSKPHLWMLLWQLLRFSNMSLWGRGCYLQTWHWHWVMRGSVLSFLSGSTHGHGWPSTPLIRETVWMHNEEHNPELLTEGWLPLVVIRTHNSRNLYGQETHLSLRFHNESKHWCKGQDSLTWPANGTEPK